MNFRDQTVMVTGAAGHLGSAVATAFAEQGANLVLLDRPGAALERLSASAAATTQLATVDLLKTEQVERAVRLAIERFGRIDVLVNVAGGFHMGEPVYATSDAAWSAMFDINVRTALHTARAVVPGMIAQGGGKVINVGAYAAQKGVAQMGAYCASKSALIRLTESLSAEVRESNLNVNCVLPTIIDTPDNRRAMPEADPSRWVAPEALAAVITFLASEQARAVHGAALPVTGLTA